MSRQRFAAQHAGEDEVRVGRLQFGARRAIAHPYEASAGALLLQATEAAHCERQVFFRRDAADVDHDGCVRPRAPGLAQRQVAEARMELPRVHRASQPQRVAEALLGQHFLQLAGRHQGGVGTVVEAAQPGEDPGAQEAVAVAADIVVKSGVEASRHRDAQTAAGAQRRPAQRAFSGDVDRIWPLR